MTFSWHSSDERRLTSVAGQTLYDAIGAGYAKRRQPDPTISAAIDEALGDARRIVNVGAGTDRMSLLP